MSRAIVVITLTVVFGIVTANGNVPDLIDFQGALTHTDGTPRNGTFSFTFKLYESPTDVVEHWGETQNGVAVIDGVFSVKLGSVTPIPQDVLEIGGLWLGITVDSEDELSPRFELTSVPYAQRADFAEKAEFAELAQNVVDDGLPPGAMVMSFVEDDPALLAKSYQPVGSVEIQDPDGGPPQVAYIYQKATDPDPDATVDGTLVINENGDARLYPDAQTSRQANGPGLDFYDLDLEGRRLPKVLSGKFAVAEIPGSSGTFRLTNIIPGTTRPASLAELAGNPAGFTRRNIVVDVPSTISQLLGTNASRGIGLATFTEFWTDTPGVSPDNLLFWGAGLPKTFFSAKRLHGVIVRRSFLESTNFVSFFDGSPDFAADFNAFKADVLSGNAIADRLTNLTIPEYVLFISRVTSEVEEVRGDLLASFSPSELDDLIANGIAPFGSRVATPITEQLVAYARQQDLSLLVFLVESLTLGNAERWLVLAPPDFAPNGVIASISLSPIDLTTYTNALGVDDSLLDPGIGRILNVRSRVGIIAGAPEIVDPEALGVRDTASLVKAASGKSIVRPVEGTGFLINIVNPDVLRRIESRLKLIPGELGFLNELVDFRRPDVPGAARPEVALLLDRNFHLALGTRSRFWDYVAVALISVDADTTVQSDFANPVYISYTGTAFNGANIFGNRIDNLPIINIKQWSEAVPNTPPASSTGLADFAIDRAGGGSRQDHDDLEAVSLTGLITGMALEDAIEYLVSLGVIPSEYADLVEPWLERIQKVSPYELGIYELIEVDIRTVVVDSVDEEITDLYTVPVVLVTPDGDAPTLTGAYATVDGYFVPATPEGIVAAFEVLAELMGLGGDTGTFLSDNGFEWLSPLLSDLLTKIITQALQEAEAVKGEELDGFILAWSITEESIGLPTPARHDDGQCAGLKEIADAPDPGRVASYCDDGWLLGGSLRHLLALAESSAGGGSRQDGEEGADPEDPKGVGKRLPQHLGLYLMFVYEGDPINIDDLFPDGQFSGSLQTDGNELLMIPVIDVSLRSVHNFDSPTNSHVDGVWLRLPGMVTGFLRDRIRNAFSPGPELEEALNKLLEFYKAITGSDVDNIDAFLNEILQSGFVWARHIELRNDYEPRAFFVAAPQQAPAGEPIKFDATDTFDLDTFGHLDVESFNWTWDAPLTGEIAVDESVSEPVIHHTFDDEGTFKVNLNVFDGMFEDDASRLVDIGVVETEAKFTYSPLTPDVDETIGFDAGSSTHAENESLINYHWVWGDGTDDTMTTDPTTTHSYSAADTYTVTLTVTDSAGGTDTVSRNVTVQQPDSEPMAEFTYDPSLPVTNELVTFDASSSTPSTDQTINNYHWAWGDGTDDTDTTNPTATHTFTVADSYTVVLTVTDTATKTDSRSRLVVVQDPQTEPDAEFDYSPLTPKRNETITFDASDSTPTTGADITSYDWDWDDGTTDSTTEPVVTHSYANAGNYTVRLTVTDSTSQTNFEERQVVVTVGTQ